MFDLTPFALGNRYFASYDPFKEMEDLEDRLFGRCAPTFGTDIRQTEQAYVLEADLPGFSKEEIQIEIKDDVLTVRAEHTEKNDENANEGGSYLRRERACRSFLRSFRLNGIKQEEITASHKDGVLTLTLPKQEAQKPIGRTISID